MAVGDAPAFRAVLTGDLVDSMSLPPGGLARARRLLTRVGRDLVRGDPAVRVACDWYRGDGWELAVEPGWCGLRAALMVRSLLRATLEADTRVTIGLGPVDDPARGAFVRSGRRLEALGREERMGVDTGEANETAAWDGAMGAVDALVASRWNGKRAVAVYGALRGLTQAQTGRLYRPRITQATVAEHLDRAGWGGLKRLLAAFEGRWRGGSGG